LVELSSHSLPLKEPVISGGVHPNLVEYPWIAQIRNDRQAESVPELQRRTQSLVREQTHIDDLEVVVRGSLEAEFDDSVMPPAITFLRAPHDPLPECRFGQCGRILRRSVDRCVVGELAGLVGIFRLPSTAGTCRTGDHHGTNPEIGEIAGKFAAPLRSGPPNWWEVIGDEEDLHDIDT
jgi:hypothetical protein